MDCSLLGSSVHGIFQARILEWVANSSSRGSSWPRDQTCLLHLTQWQAGFLPLAPPGKWLSLNYGIIAYFFLFPIFLLFLCESVSVLYIHSFLFPFCHFLLPIATINTYEFLLGKLKLNIPLLITSSFTKEMSDNQIRGSIILNNALYICSWMESFS